MALPVLKSVGFLVALLHDDFGFHKGMDSAMIGKGASFGKRELVCAALRRNRVGGTGVERSAIIAGGSVGRAGHIFPDHRGADGDGERCRAKGEGTATICGNGHCFRCAGWSSSRCRCRWRGGCSWSCWCSSRSRTICTAGGAA